MTTSVPQAPLRKSELQRVIELLQSTSGAERLQAIADNMPALEFEYELRKIQAAEGIWSKQHVEELRLSLERMRAILKKNAIV